MQYPEIMRVKYAAEETDLTYEGIETQDAESD